MQSGFRVIPKFTFVNLCKAIQSIIIIPVSSDALILETVERKEKNLEKIEYIENKRSF